MAKPERRSPAGKPSLLTASVERLNTAAETAATPPPAPTAPAAASSPASMKAVGARIATESIQEAHAAVERTMGQPGAYRTYSAFVQRAVDAELQRAREQFNGGEPFEPIQGEFRRGRPMGS